MLSNLVGAFAATGLFVFTKAFQQLNIHYDKYLLVWPFSVLLSIFEAGVIVYLYDAVKEGSPLVVLSSGIGGGLGSIIAMLLHKRIRLIRG